MWPNQTISQLLNWQHSLAKITLGRSIVANMMCAAILVATELLWFVFKTARSFSRECSALRPMMSGLQFWEGCRLGLIAKQSQFLCGKCLSDWCIVPWVLEYKSASIYFELNGASLYHDWISLFWLGQMYMTVTCTSDMRLNVRVVEIFHIVCLLDRTTDAHWLRANFE